MNETVGSNTFNKIQEFCKEENWQITHSDTWTRKGGTNQKDTNIDIILSQGIQGE